MSELSSEQDSLPWWIDLSVYGNLASLVSLALAAFGWWRERATARRHRRAMQEAAVNREASNVLRIMGEFERAINREELAAASSLYNLLREIVPALGQLCRQVRFNDFAEESMVIAFNNLEYEFVNLRRGRTFKVHVLDSAIGILVKEASALQLRTDPSLRSLRR